MAYELLWRNKWLTADAKTIDQMADKLQEASNLLKLMSSKGITLDDQGSHADDYAVLTTSEPALAKEFDFDEVELDDEVDPAHMLTT